MASNVKRRILVFDRGLKNDINSFIYLKTDMSAGLCIQELKHILSKRNRIFVIINPDNVSYPLEYKLKYKILHLLLPIYTFRVCRMLKLNFLAFSAKQMYDKIIRESNIEIIF